MYIYICIYIYIFIHLYIFVYIYIIFFPEDFNEDDYIDENDLKAVLKRLCGSQTLSQESINTIIIKVRHALEFPECGMWIGRIHSLK